MTEVTDETTERLRSQVPDDLIKLPKGWLACEACGVAVDRGFRAASAPIVPPTGNTRPTEDVPLARCISCEEVWEKAGAYVEAHPVLARRIGPAIARERIASVLFGLSIIGKKAPGDIAMLLPRLHPAAHQVWFSSPLTVRYGLCSPYPWAHVTLGQRAGLRSAYAAVLRERLALSKPPVRVECPSGGCLLCGVASLGRSAVEVERGGGIEVVTRRVWREVFTQPASLGGRGGQRVRGHVCPACAVAIDEAGAVGWTARGKAVVAYLDTVSQEKAREVREMLSDDFPFPPPLPAWGALPTPRVPNEKQWAHLRLDRLIPRPGPVFDVLPASDGF